MLQDEVPDQDQDASEEPVGAARDTVSVVFYPWMLCVCQTVSTDWSYWVPDIFLRTNLMVVIHTLGHGLVGRMTIP